MALEDYSDSAMAQVDSLSADQEHTKGFPVPEKAVDLFARYMLENLTPLESKDIENFSPTKFSQGFIQGVKETGAGLGILSYYLFADPNGKEVLGKKLNDLLKDPKSVIDKNLALAAEQINDWLDQSYEEDYENLSYDMGLMVGKICSTILLRGSVGKVASVAPGAVGTGLSLGSRVGIYGSEAVKETNPSLGKPGRMELMADMFREEVVRTISEELPESGPIFDLLWADFSQRMANNVDPRTDAQFADALKNLYLHKKRPDEYPITKETIKFLRNALVESLYSTIRNTKFSPENVVEFIKYFSRLVLAIYGKTGHLFKIETVKDAAKKIEVYVFDPGMNEVNKNAIEIGLRGITTSIEKGDLPRKESIITLTEGIINSLT